MPPSQRRPTVRGLQLGRALMEIREDRNLTRKEVGEALSWSAAKISRAENAITPPSAEDVESALDLYGGVTFEDRAALIQLARDAGKRGWWAAFKDVFRGGYPGFEDEASRLRTYEPLLIPGLLQTQDYIRAVTAASPSRSKDPAEASEILEKRVKARITRQALLGRPDAPEMHFLIGEAALRQEIGGPDVMRRQIGALWEASTKPNITIQIVPFSAGAHCGLDGPFVLMDYAPGNMRIAYTEGHGGGLYLESESDLAEMNDRWKGILSVALSSQDSEAFLLAEQTRE